ncbi:MFS transporter [Streptomyces sp. KhCrAH-43]|uniref:MFS transporter n=1 Tax=unclassified Streptomyces TaxID=2593676 RepID=UPI00037823A6|nr:MULTISPECIES: MFS transporter [unclassified Streptomyces]MYS38388.1 MFS transporter [Streptomyces sp. SID4920]MYX66580.1 MFS transporter [Streptomyces sp. SID8373]RAJ68073.1 MFS transporter [Streptomyces sp. KhCrAH-43]
MSFLRPRFPGERALVSGIAVDAVGSGMYVPFSLVFFRHVTGLPLPLIGLVLTVTGLASIAAVPLVGIAVDRFGARTMQISLYVLRGLSFACFPLAHSLPAFVVVALFTSVGTRAFRPAQDARLAELASGTDRDRLQALSRSLSNAGLGAGTMIASVVIATAGDFGYTVTAWLNGASFVAAGFLASRTPPAPPRDPVAPRTRSGGYRVVAKDRPFLGLVCANLCVALGFSALTSLLPLYATGLLDLPDGLVGSAFLLNTVLCATLGVPVAALSRRRFTTRTRAAAAGAALFSVAFIGQAALGTVRPDGVPLLLTGLLAAVLVMTVGEMVYSPSSGALSQFAAPQELRGRYLATYQLSWSLAYALGPMVFTSLIAVDARLPWLLVATTAALGAAVLVRIERRLPAGAVSFAPVPAPAPAAPGKATTTAAE